MSSPGGRGVLSSRSVRRSEEAAMTSAHPTDRRAPLATMVIFGAAGDLTKRLVVPALYNLVKAGRLPNEFQLVGVDLASKTAEEWRTGLTHTMQEFVGADGEFAVDHIDQTAWQWLTERMGYLQGDLNNPQTYRSLDAHL